MNLGDFANLGEYCIGIVLVLDLRWCSSPQDSQSRRHRQGYSGNSQQPFDAKPGNWILHWISWLFWYQLVPAFCTDVKGFFYLTCFFEGAQVQAWSFCLLTRFVHIGRVLLHERWGPCDRGAGTWSVATETETLVIAEYGREILLLEYWSWILCYDRRSCVKSQTLLGLPQVGNQRAEAALWR